MYKEDYYKLLNVAPNATEAEIKASFLKARQGVSQEIVQKITEGYKILTDANERAKYDKWYASGNRNTSGGSPAPTPNPVPTPTPAPTPTSGVPTGAPTVSQVKVLNLNNFSSRVIAVNNLDANKFPPAQYCENGLYYALEKNNNISICTKSQFDSACRQVVRAYSRGQNQPAFTKANLKKLIIWSIIAIIFIFAVTKCSNDNSSSTTSNNSSTSSYTQSDSSSTTTTPEIEKEPEIKYEEVEKPANGTVSHTYDPYGSNISVLTIKLPSYETTTYYYLKLVNSTTDEIVQSVFIHPGKTQSINVPCGTYELKYACGSKWYGYEQLFGEYGSYSKSDAPVTFEQGYEYELTLKSYVNSGTPGGNSLNTDDIDLKDF